MNAQPEYKNSPKNIWRRKLWKSVRRRLAGFGKRPQDCVVAYLPGPKDLDRKVALSLGFHSYNLIGIDNSKSICSSLRKRGATMINGDAIDVIGAWTPKNMPDAILLDLCGTLTPNVMRLSKLFVSESFTSKPIVFAINLLHGRDPFVTQLRQTASGLAPGWCRFHYNKMRNLSMPLDDAFKHRGIVFASAVVEFFYDFMEANDMATIGGDPIGSAFEVMDLEVDSYRSDGAVVYMDSAIFNWGWKIIDRASGGAKTLPRCVGYSAKASRSVGNALAIRTMRKQGQFL